MGRRKAARNANISPWLSANADCKEGRFIQVGNSFLLKFGKKPLIQLSTGARWLYLCMSMESAGHRDVTFTHGTAQKKYGIAGSSYDRYIKELIKYGLIELIADENLAQYAPNRFRFSFEWKGISPKSAPHFGEGKA